MELLERHAEFLLEPLHFFLEETLRGDRRHRSVLQESPGVMGGVDRAGRRRGPRAQLLAGLWGRGCFAGVSRFCIVRAVRASTGTVLWQEATLCEVHLTDLEAF